MYIFIYMLEFVIVSDFREKMHVIGPKYCFRTIID
jgi:hypothetical protein